MTGAPWEGNYIPVMHFSGYAYGYSGEGKIPIDVDPSTGFVGFSNCEAPPLEFDAEQLGALGIDMDGIYAQPISPPYGACCLPDNQCIDASLYMCSQMGGEWMGPETHCEPENPCEGVWVCCVMCDCYIFGTQMECEAMGGVFHPEWDSCEPNPCIGPHSPANETSWGAIKGMYR